MANPLMGFMLVSRYSHHFELKDAGEREIYMDLNQKRLLRTEIMKWLYLETDGNEDVIVDLNTFKSEVRCSAEEIDSAIMYLEGEFLLNSIRGGGDSLPSLRISHEGVAEVETGFSDTNHQTQHFVPFGSINIVNVSGDFSTKQFQQGVSDSAQVIGISPEVIEVAKNLVVAIRGDIDRLEISIETREGVTSDLDYISLELRKVNPRSGILQTCFETLRQILVAASSGLVVQKVLALPWPTF